MRAMTRLRRTRPLLETLPQPMRRAAGIGVLTLTLWMASFLALFH